MAAYSAVEVSAPARLHFGLLDCGNASEMLFGGVGAAIDGFRTNVVAEESAGKDWEIVLGSGDPDDPNAQLDERDEQELHELLERAEKVGVSACRLTIIGKAREHAGLGSKTTLLLTAGRAAMRFSLTTEGQDIDREMVTRLTHRGGTSGIGINTFWNGGIVWDSGHATSTGEREFLPSSRRHVDRLPTINARIELEPSSRVSLFYDPSTPQIEGAREVEIFEQHMPFPNEENRRSIVAAYHGLLPALLRDDAKMLASSLRELNSVGMKAKEVELQSDKTRSWLEDCWTSELAVGLSSFGPIVYCIGEADSPQLTQAEVLAQRYGLQTLGTFAFDNHGAQVTATSHHDKALAEMIAAYDQGLRDEQAFRDRSFY